MKIKLIATDMDGTLLDSKKQLPAGFMAWVKNHPDIKTVIASGRQYYTLARDFTPIQDELIYVAENGALVFEKGEIIYSNEMQKEDIQKCLTLIGSIPQATPIACGAKAAYIEAAPEHVLNEAKLYYARLELVDSLYDAVQQDMIVKLAVFIGQKMAEAAIPHFNALDRHIAPVLSGDSWIDISNRSVNKGVAVAAIQEKYSISRKESMAFGDYLNDVGLLESCEESYCMQNGHPDLKALAKHVAASNDDGGVMKVLQGL